MKQVELVVALIGEFAQLDVALGSNIGIMPTPARRGHKGNLRLCLFSRYHQLAKCFYLLWANLNTTVTLQARFNQLLQK